MSVSSLGVFDKECYSLLQMLNSHNTEFVKKYESYTAKELKKTLKQLKLSNGDVMEIKFVAKKLRSILNKSNVSQCHTDKSDALDHDNLIKKNFWGYVTRFFKKNSSSMPTFNLAQCASYFKKTFSAICPNKTFNIPNWIPTFSPHLTSRKRFLRFVQIKHSISQTGFQHSLLRKHHLILTPRPMKKLLMLFVR